MSIDDTSHVTFIIQRKCNNEIFFTPFSLTTNCVNMNFTFY